MQGDVENSRLSSEFVYDGNGVKFTRDYRIRNTADEPLFDGESFINKPEADKPVDVRPKAAKVAGGFTDNIVPMDLSREKKNDAFVDNLIKNVPKEKKEEKSGFIEI